MAKCGQDNTAFSILKTIFPRLFFLVHIFLSVWRVATVNGQVYWCLMLLVTFLIIDTVYTIVKRKGHEFKWASTSFLCFLIAAVPPIWLLELHRFERYHKLKDARNSTNSDEDEGLASLAGFNIPLLLQNDMWVQILQQTFILLLIPVRWILPRGQITRDRLSQILLVYVALGADIIEFLDLHELPAVMEDKTVFIVILVAWTASLIQFIFLLATSAARRGRMALITPQSERHSQVELHRKESVITIDEKEEPKCNRVEVSALVMTLVLQDIPFLVLRLYIMIRFNEVSNLLLFFVSKNIFVILLQFYRMCIVGCCEEEADEDHDGLADARQDTEPGDTSMVIQVEEAADTRQDTEPGDTPMVIQVEEAADARQDTEPGDTPMVIQVEETAVLNGPTENPEVQRPEQEKPADPTETEANGPEKPTEVNDSAV